LISAATSRTWHETASATRTIEAET
jgi:hypothetical protein